jgi:site-specific DNA-methyltransferase (adenine-specific)
MALKFMEKAVPHKVAKLFPSIADSVGKEKAWEEFCADLDARGLNEQIVYCMANGTPQIIDGRNRFKWAKTRKVDLEDLKTNSGRPALREVKVKNDSIAAQIAMSLNIRRRHMNPSQLAVCAHKLMDFIGEEMRDEKKKPSANGAPDRAQKPETAREKKARYESSKKRSRAAKMTGASGRSVQDVALIKKHNPALLDEIEAGNMTVKEGIRVVKREQKQLEMAKLAEKAPTAADQAQKIVVGDFIHEAKKLDQGSVNLLFGDPPYNFGKDYGEGQDGDKLAVDDYLDFTKHWLKTAAELLAPNGSLFIMVPDLWADHVGVMLRNPALALTRRGWIIWHETFGQNQSNNFNKTHRHIFYCVRDPKKCTFIEAAVMVESARQRLGDKRAAKGGKIMDDVWLDIPRLVDNAKERVPGVPTQLPLVLMERIVAVASKPGDLVVDPFCGSGTTAVACLNLGRRCITFEKNIKTAEIASTRLQAEMAKAEKAGKKK